MKKKNKTKRSETMPDKKEVIHVIITWALKFYARFIRTSLKIESCYSVEGFSLLTLIFFGE